MKPSLLFTLGVAFSVAFIPAHAQTYQWKDANGRTVISDTPPPGSAKTTARALGLPTPNVQTEKPAEKPAEGPKSSAEKDMDFKKRQQDAKEKSEKDAKEQSAAKEKQESCERARRNLAALESNQAMATFDEKGERKLMDSSQREQEMERARRFMAESCK